MCVCVCVCGACVVWCVCVVVCGVCVWCVWCVCVGGGGGGCRRERNSFIPVLNSRSDIVIACVYNYRLHWNTVTPPNMKKKGAGI